jgi:hypothetical protein
MKERGLYLPRGKKNISLGKKFELSKELKINFME